jgi:hypothetical protein
MQSVATQKGKATRHRGTAPTHNPFAQPISLVVAHWRILGMHAHAHTRTRLQPIVMDGLAAKGMRTTIITKIHSTPLSVCVSIPAQPICKHHSPYCTFTHQ